MHKTFGSITISLQSVTFLMIYQPALYLQVTYLSDLMILPVRQQKYEAYN